MITESVFMSKIAKIILKVFDNQEMRLTKEVVCKDGHFSPKMLTPEKLLCMKSFTLTRLLLYLAVTMSEEEFKKIFLKLFNYILYVANHDVHSAYNIMDNHAGSRIG